MIRLDAPMLRSYRVALRQVIKAVNDNKASENDLGMLMAYGALLDDLETRLDRVERDIRRHDRKSVLQ